MWSWFYGIGCKTGVHNLETVYSKYDHICSILTHVWITYISHCDTNKYIIVHHHVEFENKTRIFTDYNMIYLICHWKFFNRILQMKCTYLNKMAHFAKHYNIYRSKLWKCIAMATINSLDSKYKQKCPLCVQ